MRPTQADGGVRDRRHSDLVECAAEERCKGRCEGPLAANGKAHRRRNKLLLGDIHLKEAIRECFAEFIRVRRIGDFAVECHYVRVSRSDCQQGIAIGFADRFFGSQGISRQLQRLRCGRCCRGQFFRLQGRHDDVPFAAEFLESFGSLLRVQGFSVPALFICQERNSGTFFRLSDDPDRLALYGDRFSVG